jgi:hypothetical protein
MGAPIYESRNGSFKHNSIFWALAGSSTEPAVNLDDVREVAPPIGVQCVGISRLGTAKLDLHTFTFESFTPDLAFSDNIGAITFGTSAARVLRQANLTHLFESVNAPQPQTEGGNSRYYQKFFQPEMLRRSVMRAHALDAIGLMYDNVDTLEDAYIQPNMSTTRPGKIIGLSVIPPLIPAVLFCIWAFGCVVLGVIYGFSPRWAETLDAFSFLRFGADYADDIRGQPGFGSTVEFDKSDSLCQIPGLIGD